MIKINTKYQWVEKKDDLTSDEISFVYINCFTGEEYNYPEEIIPEQEFFDFVLNTNKLAVPYLYKYDEFLSNPDNIIKACVITGDFKILYKIPDKYKTYDLCLSVLKVTNPSLYPFSTAFKAVPPEYHTQEFIDECINLSPESLGSFPQRFINEKNARMSLICNGLLLENIPVELRTKELCDLPLNQNAKAVMFVPNKFLNEQRIKEIITSSPTAVGSVPKKYRTQSLFEYAVSIDAKALGTIPNEFRTINVCKKAVLNSGTALKFVPRKFRTYELCKLAVLNNPSSIIRVPPEIITVDFYNDLTNSGVKFSQLYFEYICECIKNNSPNKKEEIDEHFISPEFYSRIKNTGLSNVDSIYILAPDIVNYLNSCGVENLEQLFNWYPSPHHKEFDLFLKRHYNKLMASIRLLRCKYLNEPLFIRDMDGPMQISEVFGFDDFITSLLLNCFKQQEFHFKDLLNAINKKGRDFPSCFSYFKDIYKSDEYKKYFDEIYYKIEIYCKYLSREKDLSSNIKYLYNQLRVLEAQKDTLDSQIEKVTNELNKKLNELGGNPR